MYVCMYGWYSIWLIGRGWADCLMILGMYLTYVFPKGRFEVTLRDVLRRDCCGETVASRLPRLLGEG